VTQHQDCEAFIRLVNANVEYGGSRACYTPATDTINMPNADAFVDTPDATATQSFYSTLLHEHVHWTGHESRLDRLKSKGKFTSDYAYEELIAELGSVILAVQLGLEVQPTPDHAKYINTWLTGLKDEPRALVRAMSDASKAVAYLESEKRNSLMATAAE
ncbi:MAG: zincin-like metallopeptidase domain-containing protein, partial [Bacteroidota bacterium]|nr:zincin-like metallopeptidase domain-containing protein [Bacteroidota bacterium]